MEISRDLRDEVTFKKARAIQQANNAGQAINDFRAYLQEFDPDWLGNVDSPQRASGLKKENPEPTGKHPFTARFHLAEAQHQERRMREVRVNLEDLLQLIEEKNAVVEQALLIADARWLIVQAYRLPNPQGHELERGIKAARDFLTAHVDDPRAVYAGWWIAKTYQQPGRSDAAIAARAWKSSQEEIF